MKTVNQLSVSELTAQRNNIEAQIMSLEKNITEANTKLLLVEALNLLDRVGPGFLERHYHESGNAFTVYASRITGVKNIRFSEYNYSDDYKPSLIVKVTSPAGYLLPAEIEFRGNVYPVEFIESRHYRSGIDY